MPEIGPVRFDALFRPAATVSGDIYDVVRLDERHVGFYVADAIGHGLPAALLTMFVKKALQTKRISGKDYQIIPPAVALAELNADLCEHDLPGCQFCTAAYCVLDVASLTLTYARAGHPLPLHVAADGEVHELHSEGPLLGIFPEATFETRQCQLAHGDRLIIFTDGADHAFLPPDAPPASRGLRNLLTDLTDRPAQEWMEHLAGQHRRFCFGPQRDDVTVVLAHILPAEDR